MPTASVASRSRFGHAYKHLKLLSPRARKLLSILFAGGLFFFAFLSLSIYVKDPDSVNARGTTHKGSQRRALATTGKDVVRIGQSTRSASAAKSEKAPFRLLLASHNRLFWYHPLNDTIHVLHEGEGVHYGVFPGEVDANGQMKTLWNVIRPHNWHPKTSKEYLVQLDAETGHEVNRVQINSRFTHDAVRRGDRVYVANTEGGEVQELHFPDMKLLRGMRLFTLKQHVNTLAPLDDGAVWAVLHNLGKSDAVKIDPNADPRPRVTAEVKQVGLKAHGLVLWQGQFVMLNSEHGALVAVEPTSGIVRQIWKAPDSEDPPKFLKGLCVVDDVAYFGVNVWGERSQRDSTNNNAELAAVELTTGALLWRRRVDTRGLLNIVASPGLGEASTYRAMASTGGVAKSGHFTPTTSTFSGTTTAAGDAEGVAEDGHGRERQAMESNGGKVEMKSSERGDTGAEKGYSKTTGAGASSGARVHDVLALGINNSEVISATQQLIDMGYRPKTNGKWASGQPRLDLKTKNSPKSWEAGISLPLLQVNIDKLQELVLGMPDDMWSPGRQRKENAAVDGRKDNMNKFKPGVESVFMIFSDQSTEHVYRFPYYDYFKSAVEPLLEQILGKEDMNKVVRLQFARMKPGTQIKPHQDMGGYAKLAHRIHLPVVTHPNVSFQVCPEAERRALSTGRRMAKDDNSGCVPIPMAEGMVFELNNRVMHLVLNKSNVKRVQMVVDVAEDPRVPRRLKPGTICNYERAVMVCPAQNMLPDY